jgi:hypothetical protein
MRASDLIIKVLNFWFSYRTGKFLSKKTTIRFSIKATLRKMLRIGLEHVRGNVILSLGHLTEETSCVLNTVAGMEALVLVVC